MDDRLKGEILWGLDGHKIVAILLILTICFLAGLIFKVTIVKASISKLEANLLSYIPGYMMIKSMATDALGDSKQGVFIPIIIKEEDAQRLGFLVEERGDLCTVFLPDAPKSDAGEIRIISAASIIKLPIGVASMKHIIGNFGKGAFDSILNTK